MGRVRGHVDLTAEHGSPNSAATGVAADEMVLYTDEVQTHRAGDHATVLGGDATVDKIFGTQHIAGGLDTALQHIFADIGHERGKLRATHHGKLGILERVSRKFQQFAKGRARAIVDHRAILGRLQQHENVCRHHRRAGHILHDNVRIALEVELEMLGHEPSDGRTTGGCVQPHDQLDSLTFVVAIRTGGRGDRARHDSEYQGR